MDNGLGILVFVLGAVAVGYCIGAYLKDGLYKTYLKMRGKGEELKAAAEKKYEEAKKELEDLKGKL